MVYQRFDSIFSNSCLFLADQWISIVDDRIEIAEFLFIYFHDLLYHYFLGGFCCCFFFCFGLLPNCDVVSYATRILSTLTFYLSIGVIDGRSEMSQASVTIGHKYSPSVLLLPQLSPLILIIASQRLYMNIHQQTWWIRPCTPDSSWFGCLKEPRGML